MHVSVMGDPDDPVIVTVRGQLDLDTAPVLSTTLDQVLDRAEPRIVVDLSEVEFCDSTGLGAFVAGHNRAERTGGWVRLAAPTAWMAQLLDKVGLTGRIAVYPSVAEALSTPADG